MKITPILGRILISPLYKKETIIRPDNAKLQPTEGIVIESSVGYIKKGDGVVFGDLTGTWVDDYILLNSSDVLLVYDVLSGRDHSNQGSQNGN
jgi:co-chaperonin GroES (HSP10)